MKIIRFLILNIFMLSFAFASWQINSNHQEYFEKLCEYQDVCIKSCSYHRIYFKKKKIEYSENGIFLKLNKNEKLPLPTLSYDHEGAYLSLSSFDNHPGYIQCPYCGTWRLRGLSRCINTSCIDSYYKKKI